MYLIFSLILNAGLPIKVGTGPFLKLFVIVEGALLPYFHDFCRSAPTFRELPCGRLKRQLISSLRRSHKYRNYISIEERPKEVADRIIPGRWEGDLVAGYRNASA